MTAVHNAHDNPSAKHEPAARGVRHNLDVIRCGGLGSGRPEPRRLGVSELRGVHSLLPGQHMNLQVHPDQMRVNDVV